MEGGRKGSWKERDIEWGKSSDIWHHDLTHARERDVRLSTSWGFSNLLVLSLSLSLSLLPLRSLSLSRLPIYFLFYPIAFSFTHTLSLSLLPLRSLSLSRLPIFSLFYPIAFSFTHILSLSYLIALFLSLLPIHYFSYTISFISLLPIVSLSLLPINSLLPIYSLSYPIMFITLLPILSLSLTHSFSLSVRSVHQFGDENCSYSTRVLGNV